MSKAGPSAALLAVLVALVLAGTACANAIAPAAAFYPGFLPIEPLWALPATVLAAVLERPFVSKAGIGRCALWYSLQANLVSMVIGFVLLPLALLIIYSPFAPLWPFAAVTVSILSERGYYQIRKAAGPSQTSQRWIAWGNVFSSFVILCIPIAAYAIKSVRPDTEQSMVPYEPGLLALGVGGSVIAFAVSFLAPPIARRRSGAVVQTEHFGAEV
jgi:hypothetical protein